MNEFSHTPKLFLSPEFGTNCLEIIVELAETNSLRRYARMYSEVRKYTNTKHSVNKTG